MTMRLLFEEESGRSTGRRHPHNGYYAGDFSGRTDVPDRELHAGVGTPPLRLVQGAASSAESILTTRPRWAA